MLEVAEFRVETKTEMNQRLDAAIAAAHQTAFATGSHGVLVTRHDFSHFSVALSPEVPFGLTLERDKARRS